MSRGDEINGGASGGVTDIRWNSALVSCSVWSARGFGDSEGASGGVTDIRWNSAFVSCSVWSSRGFGGAAGSASAAATSGGGTYPRRVLGWVDSLVLPPTTAMGWSEGAPSASTGAGAVRRVGAAAALGAALAGRADDAGSADLIGAAEVEPAVAEAA